MVPTLTSARRRVCLQNDSLLAGALLRQPYIPSAAVAFLPAQVLSAAEVRAGIARWERLACGENWATDIPGEPMNVPGAREHACNGATSTEARISSGPAAKFALINSELRAFRGLKTRRAAMAHERVNDDSN